jgi:hypothetical protein
MEAEDSLIQKGDHKYFKLEASLVKRFEAVARKVADLAGLAGKEIPWKLVTQFALGIYLFLSCLVDFHRPGFVNLTAAATGVYII